MFPITQSEAGAIVQVEGDLDIVNIPDLEDLLRRLGEERKEKVILSLAGCKYCDSSALSAFVKAQQTLKDRFAVIVPPENELLQRVFAIVGMDQVLAVFPSVEAVVDESSKRATS
jgi:anti-anti-sigma factor